MTRPTTVSEAQDQLLKTALELYRMSYRLHRHRERLKVPFEIERECQGETGVGEEPPTVELALAEDIGTAIDDFQAIADRLQQAARATDVTIRREWRKQGRGR